MLETGQAGASRKGSCIFIVHGIILVFGVSFLYASLLNYLCLVYLFCMPVCWIYGSLFCCQTLHVDKSARSVCVYVSMCACSASTISKCCSPTFTILQTLFTLSQGYKRERERKKRGKKNQFWFSLLSKFFIRSFSQKSVSTPSSCLCR